MKTVKKQQWSEILTRNRELYDSRCVEEEQIKREKEDLLKKLEAMEVGIIEKLKHT